MRYKIEVTVGAGALSAVIETACKDNPDPNLRVSPILNAQPALPPQTAAWTQPTKRPRRISPEGLKRQSVVERALQTGPRRWSELRKALTDAGLPQGTLNSLISKWQSEGKIKRSEEGLWSLAEQ